MSKSQGSTIPELSVVVPLYNEADAVEPLLRDLVGVLIELKIGYEIICVNDGSTDSTGRVLQVARASNKRIRLIHLSRNFGKEAAMSAGLKYSRGRAVIPMDADLQDPPRLIPFLLAKWREGFQVVTAKRAKRLTDSWMKRVTARGFYKVFNSISETPIPEDTGDFRLLDRTVVDTVNALPERTRFMRGLFSWVGYRTAEITYERPSRVVGESKWGTGGLLRLALDGLTAFSTVPLRVFSVLGGLVAALSSMVAILLLLVKLFFPNTVSLESLLLAGVLLVGGIQLLSLGIIGEYLGRLYIEAKERPLFIVQRLDGFDAED